MSAWGLACCLQCEHKGTPGLPSEADIIAEAKEVRLMHRSNASLFDQLVGAGE